MLSNLLGIYAPCQGCGKTEMADQLGTYGYFTVKFAGALKAMIRVFLSHWGIPEIDIQRYTDGDLKETVIDGLGVTTRHLMQTLGTEWGRDCVNKEVWVLTAMRQINQLLEAGKKVVVDDVRFHNEYVALENRGSTLIKLTRTGKQAINGHASEGQLDNYGFNIYLANNGSLDEFRAQVFSTLHSL